MIFVRSIRITNMAAAQVQRQWERNPEVPSGRALSTRALDEVSQSAGRRRAFWLSKSVLLVSVLPPGVMGTCRDLDGAAVEQFSPGATESVTLPRPSDPWSAARRGALAQDGRDAGATGRVVTTT